MYTADVSYAYDADGYQFGWYNYREDVGSLSDETGRDASFDNYDDWEAAVLREGGTC